MDKILLTSMLSALLLTGCGASATKPDWSYRVDIALSSPAPHSLHTGTDTSDFRLMRYVPNHTLSDNLLADGTHVDSHNYGNQSVSPTEFNRSSGSSYSHKIFTQGAEVIKYNHNAEVQWTINHNTIDTLAGEFNTSSLFFSDDDNRVLISLDDTMLLVNDQGEPLSQTTESILDPGCRRMGRVHFLENDELLIACRDYQDLFHYQLDSQLNVINQFSVPVYGSDLSYAFVDNASYVIYDGAITKYSLQGDSLWQHPHDTLALYVHQDNLITLTRQSDNNVFLIEAIDAQGHSLWSNTIESANVADQRLLISDNGILLTYKHYLSGLDINTGTHDIGTASYIVKSHLLSTDGEILYEVNADQVSILHTAFFGYYGTFTTNAGVGDTRDFQVIDNTLILLSNYLTVDIVDQTFNNIPNQTLITGYSLPPSEG